MLPLILIFFLVATVHYHHLPVVVAATGGILLATVGWFPYFQGCFARAAAKGQDDGVVVASIVVGALCIPGIIRLIPLILSFGLKDGNPRNRWHSRR